MDELNTKNILLKTIWVLLGGKDRGVLVNNHGKRYVVSADQKGVQIIPEEDFQKDLSSLMEGSILRFKRPKMLGPEFLKKLN